MFRKLMSLFATTRPARVKASRPVNIGEEYDPTRAAFEAESG